MVNVFMVESNGGSVYIGQSESQILFSPQVTVLNDCITEDGEYLGTCSIQVCASLSPDEKSVKLYLEQVESAKSTTGV